MLRMIAGTLALTVLASCSGGSGSSSPQGAFDTAKAAVEKKDWKSFYNCADPESRDSLILVMMMGAGFMTMDNKDAEKELKAIQEKHGLKEQKDDTPIGMGDNDKMKEAAKKMFKDVSDKAGLFADIMAFVGKHGKDKGIMDKAVEGTLKDVKIEGDTAKGVMTKSDGKTEDIAFVKRNDRWYLALK